MVPKVKIISISKVITFSDKDL